MVVLQIKHSDSVFIILFFPLHHITYAALLETLKIESPLLLIPGINFVYSMKITTTVKIQEGIQEANGAV